MAVEVKACSNCAHRYLKAHHDTYQGKGAHWTEWVCGKGKEFGTVCKMWVK